MIECTPKALDNTEYTAMIECTPKALDNIAQGRDSAPWDCGSDSGPQTPTGFYKWRADDMVSASRTPKRLSTRADAPDVEPRWGSGTRGGWTAFPGCAVATLGFDVEPLRGKVDDQGRCDTNQETT